jgi:hypothetical protein
VAGNVVGGSNDDFTLSNAVADHELVFSECKTKEDYERAWEDCMKDERLTTPERGKLFGIKERAILQLKAVGKKTSR